MGYLFNFRKHFRRQSLPIFKYVFFKNPSLLVFDATASLNASGCRAVLKAVETPQKNPVGVL